MAMTVLLRLNRSIQLSLYFFADISTSIMRLIGKTVWQESKQSWLLGKGLVDLRGVE